MAKETNRKKKYNEMVYENWQANRDLGKRKFVIRFGVFSWGIGTFVIYWILMMILNAVTKANAQFTIYQFLMTLAFFMIFGVIYGIILWHRNEKIFNTKYPYGKKKK